MSFLLFTAFRWLCCGRCCPVVPAHLKPINLKLKGRDQALVGVEYQGLLIDWFLQPPSWFGGLRVVVCQGEGIASAAKGAASR
jgi:hypothetical protein